MTAHEPVADRLRELLEVLPEVVILVGPDRTVRYINRVEEGYEPEDVLGADILDFVAPDYRERQAEMFREVVETAEAASYEIPITDGDGERQWHEGAMTPLVDDGEVTGVVLVTRNVTDRHRAEEEAARLRSLLPVCSWCGKIRSDEGYWQRLETYLEEASGARVTHGMCPACAAEMPEGGVEDAG